MLGHKQDHEFSCFFSAPISLLKLRTCNCHVTGTRFPLLEFYEHAYEYMILMLSITVIISYPTGTKIRKRIHTSSKVRKKIQINDFVRNDLFSLCFGVRTFCTSENWAAKSFLWMCVSRFYSGVPVQNSPHPTSRIRYFFFVHGADFSCDRCKVSETPMREVSFKNARSWSLNKLQKFSQAEHVY